jgi:hypothetical protein
VLPGSVFGDDNCVLSRNVVLGIIEDSAGSMAVYPVDDVLVVDAVFAVEAAAVGLASATPNWFCIQVCAVLQACSAPKYCQKIKQAVATSTVNSPMLGST